MARRKKRKTRDIGQDYSLRPFVTKLRRLADGIESGKRFRIQVAGGRVSIPPDPTIR